MRLPPANAPLGVRTQAEPTPHPRIRGSLLPPADALIFSLCTQNHEQAEHLGSAALQVGLSLAFLLCLPKRTELQSQSTAPTSLLPKDRASVVYLA